MTKDGIRKGAKVCRRKQPVGAYLRPEDKPDVAPPAPVVMTFLELRGQRVRVQVPPCDTWPEGHETWFGRDELRPVGG